MPKHWLASLSLRPWTIPCVGLAIAASCSSTYYLVGYIQYKHGAEVERLAAERAERANIELQLTLDRLRDDLVRAEAQLKEPREEKPVIAAKQQTAGGIAQFTQSLGRLDQRLTELQPIPWETKVTSRMVGFASGHLQQSWIHISLSETQKSIEQRSAEYDEVIGERDRLLDRVDELEKNLSVLQASQPSPTQMRPAPPNSSASATDPDAVPTSARDEKAPIVLKNFHSPDWAPDHFNNESGSLLDKPVQPPHRPASEEG